MNFSISAIITTYNRAAFVTDAISSVFAQTHPVYELIIVDDGSTDSTELSVMALIESAPIPCRYIRKQNGGMASSLNRGVQEASFDYIAFLDDDDLWSNDHIEICVSIFSMRPSVGCVMGLREKDGILQLPPENLLCPYQKIEKGLREGQVFNKDLLIYRRKDLSEPFYTSALGTCLIEKKLVSSLGFDSEVGARLDIYFIWMLSEKTDIVLHLQSHGVARQFRVSYISTDDDAPQKLKDEIMLKRNADEIRMLKKITSSNSSESFKRLFSKALIGRMYSYRRAGMFLNALRSASRSNHRDPGVDTPHCRRDPWFFGSNR